MTCSILFICCNTSAWKGLNLHFWAYFRDVALRNTLYPLLVGSLVPVVLADGFILDV